MIQREIEIFDKKNEELISILEVFIPDEVLFNYYKDYREEDPCLFYSYEIYEKDRAFYSKYITIEFDFIKYDYFLSCSSI
ncbi:DUF7683 domain-containing protein [Treponema sp.]|uniref:DUF7683 domain-containing protein n=1 Tax=Treponema sp. TaxID=166 RepID=UPI003F0D73C1